MTTLSPDDKNRQAHNVEREGRRHLIMATTSNAGVALLISVLLALDVLLFRGFDATGLSAVLSERTPLLLLGFSALLGCKSLIQRRAERSAEELFESPLAPRPEAGQSQGATAQSDGRQKRSDDEDATGHDDRSSNDPQEQGNDEDAPGQDDRSSNDPPNPGHDDDATGHDDRSSNDPPNPGTDGTRLVISCSGGGIKSASFCLGALQALRERGRYQKAEAVVGVSGGGYVAAAFATRCAAEDKEPFSRDGGDLALLRKRTNYLTSSPRTRFDLVASLLFGLLFNFIILGSILSILAWSLAMQVRAVGLIVPVRTDQAGRQAQPVDWDAIPQNGETLTWDYNPSNQPFIKLFWAPVFMLLVAAVWFVIDRLRKRRTPHKDQTLVAWWFSNTPNSLSALAYLVAAIYPGVPYVAYFRHTFQLEWDISWSWVTKIQLATIVTFASVLIGLIRSAMKPEGRGSSRWQRWISFFRWKIAPRLGVALIVTGVYYMLVISTEAMIPIESNEFFSRYLLPIAIVALLAMRVSISANSTSMFPFYRDRLQYAFFAEGSQDTLAGVETSLQEQKRPQLVLCATANVQDADLLPSGRNGTPFIFSSKVGFTDERHLPAAGYRAQLADFKPGARLFLDVPTAAAISGAAVSPLMGRERQTIGSYRLLLALANIRLGVWIRNPYWTSVQTSPPKAFSSRGIVNMLDFPTPLSVVKEAFGIPRISAPYIYLTDGGHYDNLGLVEALRMKPDEVILLDGSGDPEDEFPAMGNAIATARMDLNMEVRFNPRRLQRGSNATNPSKAWTTASAEYKDELGQSHSITIHYLKCLLPPRMSWDLQSYQLRDPQFPATSSRHEIYDEFDFEAYRHLGWSLMDSAEAAAWR